MEFAERRAKLEPRLLAAQNADREKATKLGAVWDHAGEQAQLGNYENAFKALTRLEGAIDGLLASAPQSSEERFGIEKGIVAKRKFLLTRFKEIPKEIRPLLGDIRDGLLEEGVDDDPDELMSAIDLALQEFCRELQDEIDSSINSGDSGQLAGLKDRVLSNELITHLMANPYFDGSRIQSAMLDALTEVEKTLVA
jgi:hypothetical protein